MPSLIVTHCIMSELHVPLTSTPPYAILALAALKGVSIKWEEATNELSEPSFNGVKGTEPVRQALEEGLPGREVGTRRRYAWISR